MSHCKCGAKVVENFIKDLSGSCEYIIGVEYMCSKEGCTSEAWVSVTCYEGKCTVCDSICRSVGQNHIMCTDQRCVNHIFPDMKGFSLRVAPKRAKIREFLYSDVS